MWRAEKTTPLTEDRWSHIPKDQRKPSRSMDRPFLENRLNESFNPHSGASVDQSPISHLLPATNACVPFDTPSIQEVVHQAFVRGACKPVDIGTIRVTEAAPRCKVPTYVPDYPEPSVGPPSGPTAAIARCVTTVPRRQWNDSCSAPYETMDGKCSRPAKKRVTDGGMCRDSDDYSDDDKLECVGPMSWSHMWRDLRQVTHGLKHMDRLPEHLSLLAKIKRVVAKKNTSRAFSVGVTALIVTLIFMLVLRKCK